MTDSIEFPSLKLVNMVVISFLGVLDGSVSHHFSLGIWQSSQISLEQAISGTAAGNSDSETMAREQLISGCAQFMMFPDRYSETTIQSLECAQSKYSQVANPVCTVLLKYSQTTTHSLSSGSVSNSLQVQQHCLSSCTHLSHPGWLLDAVRLCKTLATSNQILSCAFSSKTWLLPLHAWGLFPFRTLFTNVGR